MSEAGVGGRREEVVAGLTVAPSPGSSSSVSQRARQVQEPTFGRLRVTVGGRGCLCFKDEGC